MKSLFGFVFIVAGWAAAFGFLPSSEVIITSSIWIVGGAILLALGAK